MTRSPLVMALFAAGVAALAGCGGSGGSTAPSADGPEPSPSISTPAPPASAGPAPSPADVPEAALEALGFSATTVSGDTIDVAEHAGTDVVLWMWAPW